MTIVKPVLTEKTIKLANENNQYTFEVTAGANKVQAAQDLQAQFGVKVTDVQVNNRAGKMKAYGRYRRQLTQRSNRKLMVFRLAEGNKIDLFQM